MRKAFYYFVIAVGAILILITFASLLYNSSLWYLQALNFPRLQVLIALGVCLLMFFFVFQKWSRGNSIFLGLLVLAIGIQTYILFPYSPMAPNAVKSVEHSLVKPETVISIMLANVYMKNSEYKGLLKLIADKDPTFVITMEVNDRWEKDLSSLKDRYPYRISLPTTNTYGMIMYSKLPLQNEEIRFLNHDSVPSFYMGVTLPTGSQFRLVALHPVAPKPSNHPDNINNEEVALLKAANIIRNYRMPTIAAGDFNDVGWSHNTRRFADISGLRDVRYGRGLYSTFNAESSIFRWPLDYVFVSQQFKVVNIDRLPGYGSDHFPYYVQLALMD